MPFDQVASQECPASQSKRSHILIIDDSVDELRLLLDMLRSQNYRLSVAFDGQQGYRRAEANPPDLILLDVHMPRVDGYATCRLLKANQQLAPIPVLFLTAAQDVNDRLHGFAAGAVDYIGKPFAAQEVLARVAVHLQLSQRSLPVDPLPPIATDQVLVAAAIRILQEASFPLPSLSEIAQRLGTYEKKLSKLFKQETGLTVFAYWREQKLLAARQLLEQTQIPVIDIAEQSGFQNACNFTTAFKERFAITPSAFRQSLKTEGAF